MRPIHASSGHPFAPGMRFVSDVIHEKLKHCGHILKNSDDLVRKMSSYEVEGSDVIYKLDVKDFFMSGETETRANLHVGSTIASKRQRRCS